jgi:hypothetical protein
MEFLYKQARDSEDQKRWDEADKQRDMKAFGIVAGTKSKASKRRNRQRGAT